MAVTPVTWVVNKNEVKISFSLPKENKTGTMNRLEAEIEFNPLEPAASRITAKALVSSIETDNGSMTTHLLSLDYFDAAQYPYITFVSSAIAKTDSGFTAKGDLTMKGNTRNVEIPFTFFENDTAGIFKGRMTIYCGDFGLLSNKENSPSTQTDIIIEVPVFKK